MEVVANSTSNLGAQLFAVRRLLDNGTLPHPYQALCRVREFVLASFSSWSHKKNSVDCKLIDTELKELASRLCLRAANQQVVDGVEELAAVMKIRQLLFSLPSFLQTRSEVLGAAPSSRPRLVAKLSAPFDESVAAVSVLRVFVAVGVGSIFWFATAWPAGDTFLIWVAIGTCRFVIAPNPAKAVQAFLRGTVIAAVPTYFIAFYLVPALDGFTMFVLVIFPFLFVGVGIATSLRRAGEAGAAIILFGNGLAPENIMQYDVVAFFNGVLATILGVGLACLAQSLVVPWRIPTDEYSRRHERLTHWIAASIGKRQSTGIEYVGATVRPLHDLLTLIDQLEKPEPNTADWAVDLHALGHEIVDLQQTRGHLTRTVTDCGQRLIRDISSFLQAPTPSHLLAAKGASKKGYDSCLHALESVDPNSTAADQIASSLASFAVIRHRLNQHQSIVEYTLERVQQPTKERRHAA